MQASDRIDPAVPVPRRILICTTAALFAFQTHGVPSSAVAADPERQAEVSARGAQVMPFGLSATTHVFTKTAVGGMQQVIVKDSKDARQIQLIRQHLSDIAQRFARGDFSAPTEIHGEHMPGLADLKKAKTGEITVHYQDLVDGGQIEYATQNANLVAALHKWIDAQLSDHGPDAHEGNEHQHQDMVHQ
jgi:hypothetical protein